MEVFVFGSNLAGLHSKGAAKHALIRYQAIYGKPFGRQGNAFAIPTKDGRLVTLPLKDIEFYVDQFITYAVIYRDQTFKVTRIGCGLAGYKDSEIAPMFKDAPNNCIFDKRWKPFLGDSYQYF